LACCLCVWLEMQAESLKYNFPLHQVECMSHSYCFERGSGSCCDVKMKRSGCSRMCVVRFQVGLFKVAMLDWCSQTLGIVLYILYLGWRDDILSVTDDLPYFATYFAFQIPLHFVLLLSFPSPPIPHKHNSPYSPLALPLPNPSTALTHRCSNAAPARSRILLPPSSPWNRWTRSSWVMSTKTGSPDTCAVAWDGWKVS
jgi:hypothetical protein